MQASVEEGGREEGEKRTVYKPAARHRRIPLTHAAFCTLVPRRPAADLGKNGYKDETPLQTLVREALEYQDLYHKDMDSPPGAK